MAVDTHVFRVSNRLGLTTNSKTPFATEKTLVKHFPEEILATAHHWLILHGRYVCKSRNPDCDNCGLTKYCKEYKKIKKSSATAAKSNKKSASSVKAAKKITPSSKKKTSSAKERSN